MNEWDSTETLVDLYDTTATATQRPDGSVSVTFDDPSLRPFTAPDMDRAIRRLYRLGFIF